MCEWQCEMMYILILIMSECTLCHIATHNEWQCEMMYLLILIMSECTLCHIATHNEWQCEMMYILIYMPSVDLDRNPDQPIHLCSLVRSLLVCLKKFMSVTNLEEEYFYRKTFVVGSL